VTKAIVIEALKQQRNQALDVCADLTAQLTEVLQRNADLETKLADVKQETQEAQIHG
jgi:uncharacterized protein involved in exopolysaccharide biosynthesis